MYNLVCLLAIISPVEPPLEGKMTPLQNRAFCRAAAWLGLIKKEDGYTSDWQCALRHSREAWRAPKLKELEWLPSRAETISWIKIAENNRDYCAARAQIYTHWNYAERALMWEDMRFTLELLECAHNPSLCVGSRRIYLGDFKSQIGKKNWNNRHFLPFPVLALEHEE